MFEAEAGHPLESDADAVHVEVRAKSVILEATLSVDPEVSLLFGVEKQALQPPVEESPNFEETLTPQVVDVDVDAEHPSVEPATSKREQDSASRSWDEADIEDPWNNHLSMSESTISNPKSDLITVTGDSLSSTEDAALGGTVPEILESNLPGVLEMSPCGPCCPQSLRTNVEFRLSIWRVARVTSRRIGSWEGRGGESEIYN